MFATFVLLFILSALAFNYDVNSETISREKITSTEIDSEEIDIGIELEKETKEGESFTSSITIPVSQIDKIDQQVKEWAIKQEDLFFYKTQTIDPPLSKYSKAHFAIEPIVKRVKKDFLTYEMHVQYYIEDEFNETKQHYTDITSFVINSNKGDFVKLSDVIDIPDDKNKTEFENFLSTIPKGKQKKTLKSSELETTESIQWVLNDKSIEFLVENNNSKNKVDRTFVEFKKLEKHLTDSYKKKFIPKKKKKKKPKKKEDNRKMIALTFDDGPDKKVTPRILKTLNKYDVKATFFMLGRSVNNYPEIAKDVAKQGHEIANHSITHANLNKSTKSHIENEMIQSKKIIKDATGVAPKLFRPPYGEYNGVVIDKANQSDQKVIMWSIDTLDWQHKDVNKTVAITMEQAKKDSIVLMHDIHDTTADALPKLIESLQSEGFEFVTTSELLESLDPASNGVYYGR